MLLNPKNIVKVLILALVIGIILFPNKTAKYEENVVKDDIYLADSNTPTLITPFYNTNHFVVADFVISSPSGDMTGRIQQALNQCGSNGGGTVWLERGIYNVSSPITIPTSCFLMGDWQDPDNYQGTLNYGTKIVVDVNTFHSDNSNHDVTGLFKLSPSSGIEGLTIYYKNQRVNSPVSQPWSIYYNSGMLMTVKNVTLINSYLGIGRGVSNKSAHEMLMIENVKGTVLKEGVFIHNSSDVGTITGLTLTPKYWSSANLSAFGASGNPSAVDIANSSKAIGGVGLMITDAEQSQFVNVTISGFKFGVQFPNANLIKTRYMGSGSFYNLNVSDCVIGMLADSGKYDNKTLIDYRWGYVITNSSISGTTAAINNSSSGIGKKTGTIKLNDVTIRGKVAGGSPVIYNKSGTTYSAIAKNTDLSGKVNNSGKYSNLNLYRKLKNDGTNFTYLNAGSSVDQINGALSSISSKGGGVVYLRPGVYTINKKIVVPANVELRGSSSLATRKFNTGTTLKVVDIASNIRCIQIAGNNAGVSGVNIIYEKNVTSLSKSSSYTMYDYAIAADKVSNIYIKNVSIAAAPQGIYINGCTNFAIENVASTAINSGIKLNNSRNGLLMNTLQNGTVITRNGLISIKEGTANFNYIMNPNTKKKLYYIHLVNSSDIELQNCFTYGSYTFFKAENSNFYAVNTGYDGGTGYFFNTTESNGVIVNDLRMAGTTIKKNGGSVGVYNTAKIGDISEKDVSGNIFKVSKKYIGGTIKLSASSVTLDSTKEISYNYGGDGNLSCSSSNASIVSCGVNLDKKVIVIAPVNRTNAKVTITVSAGNGVNYSGTSATITATVSGEAKGDVDGNGKVDVADYVKVRNHITKASVLSGNELRRADANGDNKIDNGDYVLIRSIIIGIVHATPTPVATPVVTPPPAPVATPVQTDTTPPTIYGWSETNLSNTVVNSRGATTTICNLGSDTGSGLKLIEYRTNCTDTKTATINNNCTTISVNACANSTLYYRLKDSNNYSSQNTVSNFGKYVIYAQVYNQLLYLGTGASNNSNNIGFYVGKCSTAKISSCIKNIGTDAVKKRTNDSNQLFLEYTYKGILGRSSDASGLSSWLSQLKKGVKRDKVVSDFIASKEAKSLYAAWGYN